MAFTNYTYTPYQYGQVNPIQPYQDRLTAMQQQYQQSIQPSQQVPQTNQGLLWVQGEAGAKSYLVAPNTSVLLMDSEDSIFYIKTTDQTGMPTLRTFKYTEVVPGQEKTDMTEVPKENLDSKYVTRNEYTQMAEMLNKKYEELSKSLKNMEQTSKTDPERKGVKNNAKSTI